MGIDEVHLQKLFWSQGELRAKIVWKARRKASKYTVSWWSGPCRNVIDGYDTYKLSATTKVNIYGWIFVVCFIIINFFRHLILIYTIFNLNVVIV